MADIGANFAAGARGGNIIGGFNQGRIDKANIRNLDQMTELLKARTDAAIFAMQQERDLDDFINGQDGETARRRDELSVSLGVSRGDAVDILSGNARSRVGGAGPVYDPQTGVPIGHASESLVPGVSELNALTSGVFTAGQPLGAPEVAGLPDLGGAGPLTELAVGAFGGLATGLGRAAETAGRALASPFYRSPQSAIDRLAGINRDESLTIDTALSDTVMNDRPDPVLDAALRASGLNRQDLKTQLLDQVGVSGRRRSGQLTIAQIQSFNRALASLRGGG
jgi:hypothetical protein